MIMDTQVVHGPTAPGSEQIIYQVTLEGGLVLTNPAAFGTSDYRLAVTPVPVIAEDGRVLAPAPSGPTQHVVPQPFG
jgi:hypothetical protein